jgi:hypothetical protein
MEVDNIKKLAGLHFVIIALKGFIVRAQEVAP